MFVLTNVRPIKSPKKVSAKQKLELSHLSQIRRAKSELTLKLGSEPSLEQLSSELNESLENLQTVFAKKPVLAAVSNKILESQYLSQRISQLLNKLTNHESEVIASHFGLDPQTSKNEQNEASSKIAYLAERRLKKLVPQEEFGNFLA
ncbi:hypothetical protein KA183_17820 [bacterium]|nr:hypothetical protein [bacterium]QQR57350.1 MAG: hypothetical protein IPG59_20605 [Candidatus Melainabacteria bacterium]